MKKIIIVCLLIGMFLLVGYNDKIGMFLLSGCNDKNEKIDDDFWCYGGVSFGNIAESIEYMERRDLPELYKNLYHCYETTTGVIQCDYRLPCGVIDDILKKNQRGEIDEKNN